MSNVPRGWVVGAWVVIIAAVGFAAAAHPRRAQKLAAARQARHSAGSSRPAGEMPAIAPVPEAPRPVPDPPPRRAAPRVQPAPAGSVMAVSNGVMAVLRDPPAPEPDPLPMLWEHMFPVQAGSSRSSASSMPCFDQLQGIGGVSPCSEVTVRALTRR